MTIADSHMHDQVVSNPFTDLPALMKDVLMHEENIDLNIAIEKSNGLNHKQGDMMMGVIRKIILKTITPEELASTIVRDIGLDETAAKKLALDLLSKRFLPMEWYIGKVQPLISELGGNAAEALAEATRRYPEVYAPQIETKPGELIAEISDEHPLLRDFDQRVSTLKGKAEILLRLTGLSSQLEEAAAAGRLDKEAGERLMQDLDAVSYAVNTQDLNPFEINSLKRRIRRVLQQVEIPAQ